MGGCRTLSGWRSVAVRTRRIAKGRGRRTVAVRQTDAAAAAAEAGEGNGCGCRCGKRMVVVVVVLQLLMRMWMLGGDVYGGGLLLLVMFVVVLPIIVVVLQVVVVDVVVVAAVVRRLGNEIAAVANAGRRPLVMLVRVRAVQLFAVAAGGVGGGGVWAMSSTCGRICCGGRGWRHGCCLGGRCTARTRRQRAAFVTPEFRSSILEPDLREGNMCI